MCSAEASSWKGPGTTFALVLPARVVMSSLALPVPSIAAALVKTQLQKMTDAVNTIYACTLSMRPLPRPQHREQRIQGRSLSLS